MRMVTTCRTEQIKALKPVCTFSFELDEVNIADTGKGGYYGGYYWRLFEFGQFGPCLAVLLGQGRSSELL